MSQRSVWCYNCLTNNTVHAVRLNVPNCCLQLYDERIFCTVKMQARISQDVRFYQAAYHRHQPVTGRVARYMRVRGKDQEGDGNGGEDCQ